MGKLAKVVIGCAALLFLAAVAVVGGVFGLAWWGRTKIEKLTADETRVQELYKKADAVPFTPPADGVVAEERLLKLIDARRRVYATYEKHRAQIEVLKEKKDASLGDVASGIGLIREFRAAHAQALVDVGMSQAEYQFLVASIYKSAWMSEWSKDSGKTVAEATGEAWDEASEAVRKSGSPEAEKLLEKLAKQTEEARELTKQMDVPQANIELFRKHEAELKKYAMTGLELFGL